MGIIFDEVIGRVEGESDGEAGQQASFHETPAPPAPQQPPLDQLLRRLQQRAARLRAD